MLVEAGEQASQIVQVGAHHVRRTVAGHHRQRLFELQQTGRQLRFAIFADGYLRLCQHGFVNLCLAEYRQHAGVGILHVWRGVAFEGQHVIPVEYVVGGTVLGEIRIFHRTDTDGVRQFFQLVCRHVRVFLCHQTAGTLQRLVQQIRQLHGTARTGFKRFAVFTQHHAEHVVFQRHGIRHIARFTHDGPRLHQMLVLTGVNVIEDAIRMQRFVAIFGAGDIGGRVEVAAILFLDDDAHRFAFLVFVLIKEDHRCAFAFDRQPFGFQVGHDPGQHRVVQALAHHVFTGQGHVQTIVGELVLGHGDVHQLAPHLTEVLVAALQFHHVATRALGKGFVFVVVLFRIAVEAFQVRQRHLTGVILLLFFQPGDQHAELGAPVADVVRTDHVVAEELQGAHGGITDDGGAQVADVHLFRHVRGGVVDDDGLRLRLRHAQTVGFQGRIYVLRQEGRVEEDIDKARPGDFGFAGDTLQIQVRQDLLCELSRRHAQFFSHCHHAIGLIVAKLYFR